MAKIDVLAQLANAKKAHVGWVTRANALIEGYHIGNEATPQAYAECPFGEWFHGDGKRLNDIPGMNGLDQIEQFHYRIHDVYRNIFEIYTAHEQPFFSKLLGYPKKIATEDQALAREHYRELKELSEKMVLEIERIERRLLALPEKSFERFNGER